MNVIAKCDDGCTEKRMKFADFHEQSHLCPECGSRLWWESVKRERAFKHDFAEAMLDDLPDGAKESLGLSDSGGTDR